VLLCASMAVTSLTPARASINSMNLGAAYNSGKTTITFRVYSSQATYMMLYLYATGYGVQESLTEVLSPAGSGVWAVTVPVFTIQAAGVTGAVYYGYRAWGPNWPYSASWTKGSSVGFISDVDASGNRFNPNKLLLDPYAREISQDPLNASNQDGTIFASGASYRAIDSGTYAPKGIVPSSSSQSTGTKPTRAQKDDVIYEVHLRGLTKQDPNTPAAYQGTYYGAELKAPYLGSLGITAVEFQPM
jgi:glycogen operon protein